MGLEQQQDFSLPGNKRKNNSGQFILMRIFREISHPVYIRGIILFNDSVKRHLLMHVSFYFNKQKPCFIYIDIFRKRKFRTY